MVVTHRVATKRALTAAAGVGIGVVTHGEHKNQQAE